MAPTNVRKHLPNLFDDHAAMGERDRSLHSGMLIGETAGPWRRICVRMSKHRWRQEHLNRASRGNVIVYPLLSLVEEYVLNYD